MQKRTNFWRPYRAHSSTGSLPRISSARGVWLHSEGGGDYLDGISGAFNTSLGHSHPGLSAAVVQQIGEMAGYSAMWTDHQLPQDLACKMGEVTHNRFSHVFFSLSGSEAVECALKMALTYQHSKGRQKSLFGSHVGAYHGNTLGILNSCTQREYDCEQFVSFEAASGFAIPPPMMLEQPSNEATNECIENWRAMFRMHGENIAAVVVEPVAGLDGVKRLPIRLLQEIRELTRNHGSLLISDEILCGAGRTGSIVTMPPEIEPDILLLSKCLGGGFPISATLATPEVSGLGEIEPFRHGQTNTGSLIGCAAANYVLAEIGGELLESVMCLGEEIGSRLRVETRNATQVLAIRSEGLLIGIQFDKIESCEDARVRALNRGLVVSTCGSVLFIAPALNINCEEAYELVKRMVKSICL